MEDILKCHKCHNKYCFKINGKERILTPKKVNMLNSRIIREKQSHIFKLIQILKVSYRQKVMEIKTENSPKQA